MKVMKNLLLASMLAASYEAGAAISAETSKPGELFLVVYQASTGTTYYKDLGLTADKFLASTPGACLEGNIASDPNYKGFQSASAGDLTYVVAAVNGNDRLGVDWGYLATSPAQDSIFVKTPVGVDRTLQAIQGYDVALNGTNPYDVSKNLSGVILSTGNKFANFNGGFFGPTMNKTLLGSAAGSPASNPQFFFVSGKDSKATLLGNFNLSAGVLTFTSTSGKGITAICGGAPAPTPTPTPTPAPVTPDVGVSVSPSTTKFGKVVRISVSPKDKTKKTVLAYSKDGGPFVTFKTLNKGLTSTTWKPTLPKVGKGVIRACASGSTSNCGTANLTVTK
jgi:hypothetical protein